MHAQELETQTNGEALIKTHSARLSATAVHSLKLYRVAENSVLRGASSHERDGRLGNLNLDAAEDGEARSWNFISKSWNVRSSNNARVDWKCVFADGFARKLERSAAHRSGNSIRWETKSISLSAKVNSRRAIDSIDVTYLHLPPALFT